MEYAIRNMRENEHPLLEDFLYLAIYVPEGFTGRVPRSIIRSDPKCRAAYEGFGKLSDDRALVAESAGEVVGACWVRTTDEYGHIDSATPSFSISVREGHRGRGIGGALMRRMLEELEGAGYARASLSVQKENPACRLYKRLGFDIVGNGADESEWLMVRALAATFPVIETERLILRPWLESDAAALFDLARDPDVGPAAGWPAHASAEESAYVIEGVLSAPETFAVIAKATGELAGCAGFNSGEAANMPLDECEFELGYWIGKPFWGRGFATEAARAVVERGFADCGLSGIRASVFEENTRSRRVLEKLGFSLSRIERDVSYPLIGAAKTTRFMYLPNGNR